MIHYGAFIVIMDKRRGLNVEGADYVNIFLLFALLVALTLAGLLTGRPRGRQRL